MFYGRYIISTTQERFDKLSFEVDICMKYLNFIHFLVIEMYVVKVDTKEKNVKTGRAGCRSLLFSLETLRFCKILSGYVSFLCQGVICKSMNKTKNVDLTAVYHLT